MRVDTTMLTFLGQPSLPAGFESADRGRHNEIRPGRRRAEVDTMKADFFDQPIEVDTMRSA
jgi:hypothetical protein